MAAIFLRRVGSFFVNVAAIKSALTYEAVSPILISCESGCSAGALFTPSILNFTHGLKAHMGLLRISIFVSLGLWLALSAPAWSFEQSRCVTNAQGKWFVLHRGALA